jgi:hypothetical protein
LWYFLIHSSRFQGRFDGALMAFSRSGIVMSVFLMPSCLKDETLGFPRLQTATLRLVLLQRFNVLFIVYRVASSIENVNFHHS